MTKCKMKRMRFQLFLVLALINGMAQLANAQDAITTCFKEYADDPNYTSIVVSSKMFELFANIKGDDAESKAVKDVIKGLSGIRILVYDGDDNTKPAHNFKSAVGKVSSAYEVLMSVDEQNEKIRFYVREKADKIEELLMIVAGQDHLFLMSLTGNIDLAKISSLSKNMNIGGMEYLENLDEKNKNK